jgi:hypothetical protein
MDLAAGEYGYDLYYFERADVTRCAGVTGFLQLTGRRAHHLAEVVNGSVRPLV